MKKSSVNWKNNFSQLSDFFNSTKRIPEYLFMNFPCCCCLYSCLKTAASCHRKSLILGKVHLFTREKY